MRRNGARGLMSLFLVCSSSFLAGAPVWAAEASPRAYERVTEQLSQAISASQQLDQEVVAYDAVFRRNPMRPLVDGQGQLVTSVGLKDGLSVQGVIWSSDHPFAVIDEDLVAPGAIIGPYTILQIQADGVVVKRGDEVLTIPLDRGLEPSDTSATASEPAPVLTPAVEPAPPVPTESTTPLSETEASKTPASLKASSDQKVPAPADESPAQNP